MLNHEVPIKQDRFHLGKKRVIAIEMGPACLHKSYGIVGAPVGAGKVVDHLHEPVAGRGKVGIEDSDKFAGRGVEAVVERAGLVAVAVGAVNVLDRRSRGRIASNNGPRGLLGLVRRVIEQLDLQAVARVIECADACEQALDHELLVVDGQLNGDARQLVEAVGRLSGGIAAIFEVGIDELVAMHAEEGKRQHHQEVGNEQREVEGIPAIQVLVRRVRVVRLQIL